ncbi:MAG: hypothetical protein CL920_30455 [Deltaproteobacteria bacterium]|nr:hypothetical protein [Deltaproteobacteria bacterium]
MTSKKELVHALLEGMSAGDETCFRRFVEETHADVYKICMAILHQQADAEEVTQEVYIKLHLHLQEHSLSEEGYMFWLRQVATRASIDHLRSLKRRWRRLTTYFTDFMSPSVPSKVTSYLTLKEALRALDTLSEAQRVAFTLYTMGGLSLSEIAALEGSSEKAIEQRIVRARRTLRQKLDR